MKTVNLIYVGRFASVDPEENDRDAERASALVGAMADSSTLQIVSAKLEDGGDGRVEDDDFDTNDTFTYDLGTGAVTQKTDASLIGVVRVVDAGGNAADVRAQLIQAVNGDLFLNDVEGGGTLDNLDIASVEIRSIQRDNLRGWESDQSVEGSTIVPPLGGEPPTLPDGTVDGEASGETMVLGYDDSNPPTDQGGDRITTGNDVIFGNGGADIIDGDAGNDVIYGDGGLAQSGPVAIEILSSTAGFSNGVLAYTIDVETGTISNLTLLSPNAKEAIGNTFIFNAPEGAVVGVGIRSPGGDFLSSGYGDNLDLNPDAKVHTQLIEERPDGSVVLGFEDRFNLGDQDFDDVVLRVDLGTSGATLDNAHVVYSAPDNPGGPPGDDTIFGGLGDDTIYGQDGADVIRGEEGDDDLFGGDGDDDIDGGSGGDGLDGGDGADTIRLGRADDDDPASGVDGERDVASGGDDADTFLEVGVDDFIDGGAGGTDQDTLDLRGSAPAGGSIAVNTSGVDSDGNGFNGTVEYFDGDRNLLGTSTFFNIETIVPCFTPGTLIATALGEMLVEDLKVGDRLITRDNGIQPIRWTGHRRMTPEELDRAPHLRPVRVRRGVLGFGLPERDMLVSPNHRFLVVSDKTALYFEESEVLVAAKHLIGLDGVEIACVEETVFVHFMFDQHEVVLSDGAWTESFQPGAQTLDALGDEQREELFELFPELRTREGIDAYSSARRSLRKHEARLLVLQ